MAKIVIDCPMNMVHIENDDGEIRSLMYSEFVIYLQETITFLRLDDMIEVEEFDCV